MIGGHGGFFRQRCVGWSNVTVNRQQPIHVVSALGCPLSRSETATLECGVSTALVCSGAVFPSLTSGVQRSKESGCAAIESGADTPHSTTATLHDSRFPIAFGQHERLFANRFADRLVAPNSFQDFRFRQRFGKPHVQQVHRLLLNPQFRSQRPGIPELYHLSAAWLTERRPASTVRHNSRDWRATRFGR